MRSSADGGACMYARSSINCGALSGAVCRVALQLRFRSRIMTPIVKLGSRLVTLDSSTAKDPNVACRDLAPESPLHRHVSTRTKPCPVAIPSLFNLVGIAHELSSSAFAELLG
jgi:hypothetical protein